MEDKRIWEKWETAEDYKNAVKNSLRHMNEINEDVRLTWPGISDMEPAILFIKHAYCLIMEYGEDISMEAISNCIRFYDQSKLYEPAKKKMNEELSDEELAMRDIIYSLRIDPFVNKAANEKLDKIEKKVSEINDRNDWIEISKLARNLKIGPLIWAANHIGEGRLKLNGEPMKRQEEVMEFLLRVVILEKAIIR